MTGPGPADGLYVAVLLGRTDVPDAGHTSFGEEVHVIRAADLAAATREARRRAAAQATRYPNADGQEVVVAAAEVVEVGPALFHPDQDAVYRRSFTDRDAYEAFVRATRDVG